MNYEEMKQMSQTAALATITDIFGEPKEEHEAARVRTDHAHHTASEQPSRVFLLRHPNRNYGLMESGLLVWTPGVLTLCGDLGDLVISNASLLELEPGLEWLSRSVPRYLASKTSVKKEFRPECAWPVIIRDLLDELKSAMYHNELVDEGGVADPLPETFDWSESPSWMRLASYCDRPVSGFRSAATRLRVLKNMVEREPIESEADFNDIYSEILGGDDVPSDSVYDYPPDIIRKIQIAQSFAEVLLATPGLLNGVPAEEPAAPAVSP